MSDTTMDTGETRTKRINPKRESRKPRKEARRKKLRGEYHSSFVDKRAGNLPLRT